MLKPSIVHINGNFTTRNRSDKCACIVLICCVQDASNNQVLKGIWLKRIKLKGCGHTTTQVLPDGTVTTMPLLIVIGPALTALLPVPIV